MNILQFWFSWDNWKKLFTPFEIIDKKVLTTVGLFQAALLVFAWAYLVPDKTFFPRLGEVADGWADMWANGLGFHITQTLTLCLTATVISIVFSCIVAYSSRIPFFHGIAAAITKLRYNPIQGFTLFLTTMTGGGRVLQVTMLVIFMSFYFITALMSVIDGIPEEDILRRKAQGMGRWRVLWRVVICDRADYLIEVIRQNLSITFMMIVSVEAMNKAAGGLGALLVDRDRGLNFPKIFALQLTILFIGIALDALLRWIFRSFPANSKR